MQEVMVNWWAVLVAAVATMVLGSLWYGPLFGKTWMKLMGWNPEECMNDPEKKKGMGKKYLIQFIGFIITSWVLVYVITFASAFGHMTGIQVGLMSGFWVWLGFIATTTLGMVLWEGKPWKLWILLNSYQLVALLVSGAILAAWM